MKRFFDILGNIFISCFLIAIIFSVINYHAEFITEGFIAQASKSIYYTFSTINENETLIATMFILCWFILKAIFTERAFTKIIFILLLAGVVVCIFFPDIFANIFSEAKLIS